MFEAINTIKAKQPKFFILENVKGLVCHKQGKSLQSIKDELQKLDNYNVTYNMLNTKDFGIPQNRERLYIIGVRDTVFTLNRIPIRCPPIRDFLDTTLLATREKCLIPRRQQALDNAIAKHKIDVRDDWIVTIAQSVGPYTISMKDVCPTLTTNCAYYYVTSEQRILSI